MLGQVDYSTILSGITGEYAVILALGLAIAVAVVGLFAAPKGVKFVRQMWNAVQGDDGPTGEETKEFHRAHGHDVDRDDWTPY